MLRSVLGNIDVWGIVLKAVLIIVAVVLIVTLVVYLCRLPMNLMRAKFKRSAGIELNLCG